MRIKLSRCGRSLTRMRANELTQGAPKRRQLWGSGAMQFGGGLYFPVNSSEITAPLAVAPRINRKIQGRCANSPRDRTSGQRVAAARNDGSCLIILQRTRLYRSAHKACSSDRGSSLKSTIYQQHTCGTALAKGPARSKRSSGKESVDEQAEHLDCRLAP